MARLGSTVLRFDSLPSTNDLAKEMAADGVGEGTAILARGQSAGRGRQGRQWSSPPGEGLYLSLILRPETALPVAQLITLAAAVAVAETLRQDFGVDADIKWPNDVLAGGRKICGILAESVIEGDRLTYTVLGIGVNLLQREFADEIRQAATSLLIESGRAVTPDDFLAPLLDRLDRWYRLTADSPAEVIDRWQSLSSYASGCNVRIISPDEVIEGVTRGLTSSGALVVELGDGARREIVSGEVSLRK